MRRGAVQAALEVGVQRRTAVLHVEDLGQLADAFIDAVDLECLQAGAIGTHQVVLAFAVRRQQVGRDLQLVELFTGTHHALCADHPLELHCHQLRTLAHHSLEARVVVGQALDPVVHGLELGQHVVEPQRRARQRVAQAQCIEDLGAGLADGDRTLRGVGEGLGHAAVVDRERVVGGSGLGQAGEAEASDQGGNTGQHGGRSPIEWFTA
ncbi:hypothetical protein D3C80_1399620 [compost metagenome]